MKDTIHHLAMKLRPYRHHILAVVLISAWCAPYLTSGQRIEWGDFSFFAQGYEAIRISILEYHQFPWWNPWISGGVPLYANPQMGVFSIQTICVLLFGSVGGLKIALSLYTFAGYASMFVLLRKYFKVEALIATLVSLLWIFCTFFVAHLPPHVTFAWYMLAPLYMYLVLNLKNWQGGLWLGGAFAIMALSQVHNAFVHISVVCGLILIVRLITERTNWRALIAGAASAVGVFLVIAGHRIMLVFQNYQDFPRELVDPWARRAILGPFLPFSQAHGINFPTAPLVPGGLVETTASIGLCAMLLFIICFVVAIKKYWQKKSLLSTTLKRPFIVLLAAASAGIIALGPFAAWAAI